MQGGGGGRKGIPPPHMFDWGGGGAGAPSPPVPTPMDFELIRHKKLWWTHVSFALRI